MYSLSSGEQPVRQVVVARRPEHCVEVVGHQAPGQHAHRQLGAGLAQQAGEGGVVVGAVEDLGSAVADVQGVVALAAHGGASAAGHAAILDRRSSEGKSRPAGALSPETIRYVPLFLLFLLFLLGSFGI